MFLPGESQGLGSLVGCRLWGCIESDTTEVFLAAAATAADSILKSRDVALSTKVRLVKAMVFPVVMYGCES